tara:strand:+ start:120284 stop:120619 length:336 start_codon:yes stop_codon:yes gene_type:complete
MHERGRFGRVEKRKLKVGRLRCDGSCYFDTRKIFGAPHLDYQRNECAENRNDRDRLANVIDVFERHGVPPSGQGMRLYAQWDRCINLATIFAAMSAHLRVDVEARTKKKAA